MNDEIKSEFFNFFFSSPLKCPVRTPRLRRQASKLSCFANSFLLFNHVER